MIAAQPGTIDPRLRGAYRRCRDSTPGTAGPITWRPGC